MANSVEQLEPEKTMDWHLIRMVLDNLTDAILITDTAGVTQCLNRAAVQLLGVAYAEANGRPVHEIAKLQDGVTGEPIVAPLSYLLAGTDTFSTGSYAQLSRRDGMVIPMIDCSISTIHASHHMPPGLVVTLRDASRTHARIEQLVEAMNRDEHTQLVRRAVLERRLAYLLQSMDDGDSHVLLFMDLDGFKVVNEHAGHATGAVVLREVAALFSAQVRDCDTLAHFGGDEFGLLLEDCPLVFARKRAQALHVALAKHTFKIHDQCIALGVNIGISAINHGRHDIHAVIAAADAAWVAAKRLTGAAPRIGESILE